ncbi:MAG: hypothetical protein D6816_06450 [Bacteroidetes bacterium]|nr:MAG: hypothetical protein D6816_06450 [Bacteroidota bacterium]
MIVYVIPLLTSLFVSIILSPSPGTALLIAVGLGLMGFTAGTLGALIDLKFEDASGDSFVAAGTIMLLMAVGCVIAAAAILLTRLFGLQGLHADILGMTICAMASALPLLAVIFLTSRDQAK